MRTYNDAITFALEEIKDMVLVTGSYAEDTATGNSDLDLYIKRLPEDKIDYERGVDTYYEELLDFFKKRGFKVESCGPLTFAVTSTPLMLDFSALFEVDLDNTFEIEVYGVTMTAAKSTYTGLDR